MTALLDIPTFRLLARVRRAGAALLLASSIVAAAPGAANASEDRAASVAPPSCSDAAIGAPSIPLAGAVFTPRQVDGGIAWDARFVLDVDAAFDFHGGVIPFAVPLGPGETLVATPGVAAIARDERIVGLCVARDALRDRVVSASFVQPLASSPARTFIAGAPVVAGSAVQIIETSFGERRLDPATTPALERHVGYVAPRAISHAAREEARRLTGVHAKVSTSPIYVRGDDVRALGGVTANIVDPQTRARSGAAFAGIAFASVVGALVLAARKLRSDATVEQADALLASEIDEAARAVSAREEAP